MIEGVPICTDHNPTKWHPLVKRDSAGAIICTYGHEHHHDPNSVNDIFGPPSAWYGGNQEISYPWQTFKFDTPPGVDLPYPTPPADLALLENASKHEGYKWQVKRDLPCVPFWPAPNDGCIRAWRIQFHMLGAQTDTVTRFHSFSMEALVEYQGKQGIVRGGGWMDTNHLGVYVDGGNTTICPALPTNAPTFTCKTSGTHRGTASINAPAPHINHANPGQAWNWYASHRGVVQAGPQVQEWGPTDYSNPTQQNFYDPKFRSNNHTGNIENLSVTTNFSYLSSFRNGDNIVNVKGFEDRYGNYLSNGSGCTVPSVDCVPFSIENAPFTKYLLNRNTNSAFNDTTDHDVMSPVTGKSLIKYPN